MTEESQEEKIQKILKETEKIKQENQALKEEIDEIKNQQKTQEKKENLHNEDISRREFLKKAGLGTLGLGALLSPVSALDVKTDDFNVLTSSGGGLAEGLKVDSSQNVMVPNGNMGIGVSNPSLPLEIGGSNGVRIPVGDNSQRSDSPKEGEFRINSEEEQVEVYFSGDWRDVGSIYTPIEATGGDDVFTITDSEGVEYKVHAFTKTGGSSFEIQNSGSDGLVDVLVVAGGGGGGGGAYGGGGGAGGLLFKANHEITGQNTISVKVGDGGEPGAAQSTDGSSGENTEFGSVTALGGGYGTARDGGDPAGSGGSGGGAGYNPSTGGEAQQPGSEDGGYGKDGGSESSSGCGGGGAGQKGPTGPSSNPYGANGGDGLNQVSVDSSDYNLANTFGTKYGEAIDGEAWFAGGGASGGSNSAFDGGKGGGGDGDSDGTALEGQSNTGGGGAGGGYDGSNHKDGAPGGSGVVLIRYPLEKP